MADSEPALDAWFLHEKLILRLLGDRAHEIIRRVPADDAPMALQRRVQVLEDGLEVILKSLAIDSLAVAYERGALAVGTLVWLEQDFYFKGVGPAVEDRKRGGPGRASMAGTLNVDRAVKIRADFGVQWLTSSTARSELSGKRSHFVLGYITSVADASIELRLVAIATRWERPTPVLNSHPVDPFRLWVGEVDQFAGVDWTERLRPADLEVLRAVPEQEVKEAFASILAEPVVPKDWGGEQFDLWTTRMFVGGVPLAAAIMFKGPAFFRPMTIAALGKNGDQIDRLATTAADVLVVQHCQAVTAPVVNMLRAYAAGPGRERRYMLIDGYDTVRLLRHFKKLPPKKRAAARRAPPK